MAVNGFILSDAKVLNLFKKKYLKFSQNMYNGKNEILGRVKKSYDVVGDETVRAIPIGFSGGSGGNAFGDLPQANRAQYEKATFQTKSLYVVSEIDRRTVAQSKNAGAFVEGMKETVSKSTEEFNWLMSFVLFGDGTGKLGIIDSGGVTDNGGGSYSVVISAASYKRAVWEKGKIVNVGSSSDRFEVTNHVPSTRTVTIVRLAGGSTVPVAADSIYLQSLINAAPEGLKGVLDATSSTKYGIDIQYRWQAFQKAAASATINTDLMNECMLGVHEQCGESPNLIVTSYVQMRKLLSQLEDQKRYFSSSKMSSRYGDFSFNAVQFMSIDGPVNIVVDRFCEDDRMYFLNDNFIEICHAPGSPGWADDEGFVFLRKAGTDRYDARYAAYLQIYIPPTMHGVLTGLATD